MSGKLLRWAALPVMDRRWAAALSAVALGFGLFVGVAIGPGAAGSFATGAAQIIEVPGFSGGTESGGEDEGPSSTAVGSGSGGGGSIPASGSALPSSGATPPSFAASSPPEPVAPPEPSPPPSPSGQTGLNLALASAVAVGLPDTPTESECGDMATILWQIYADDPPSLPFPDAAALGEWLCAAPPP